MIFVYIFIGLIVLLLVISAMMPKSYSIEKSIVINKSPLEVMGKVSDLNYYSKWNPWQQSDPSATNTITGAPGTQGHKYAWQGKKVGVGSLTLLDKDAQHIHFQLEFFKPFKSKAKDNWLFESWGDGNQTKVTWQNSGGFPWPMASLMGPMILKGLNTQFEKGLSNLKTMCEAS
jgi:Polyketide cyclase / dehydrase and lipid transport